MPLHTDLSRWVPFSTLQPFISVCPLEHDVTKAQKWSSLITVAYPGPVTALNGGAGAFKTREASVKEGGFLDKVGYHSPVLRIASSVPSTLPNPSVALLWRLC